MARNFYHYSLAFKHIENDFRSHPQSQDIDSPYLTVVRFFGSWFWEFVTKSRKTQEEDVLGCDLSYGDLLSTYDKSTFQQWYEVESAYEPSDPWAWDNTCLCSMKRLGVSYLYPSPVRDGRRAGTHLERSNTRVKFLGQEHNTMPGEGANSDPDSIRRTVLKTIRLPWPPWRLPTNRLRAAFSSGYRV